MPCSPPVGMIARGCLLTGASQVTARGGRRVTVGLTTNSSFRKSFLRHPWLLDGGAHRAKHQAGGLVAALAPSLLALWWPDP